MSDAFPSNIEQPAVGVNRSTCPYVIRRTVTPRSRNVFAGETRVANGMLRTITGHADARDDDKAVV